MSIKRISSWEMEKILKISEVDAGNAMFEPANRRQPAGTRLTLIIGIGGSGLAVLGRVKAELDRTVRPGYSQFVSLLAVDTDEHDLAHARAMGIECLNVFNPSLAAMHPAAIGPLFDELLPGEMPPGGLGAGTRMTAPLHFYSYYGNTTNDERLRMHIHYLLNRRLAAFNNLPLDIVIVAGLGGNAGGGLFADVAAQARQACLPREDVRVFGYFVLPDAMDHMMPHPAAASALRANGFAALKELESSMSMDLESDREEVLAAPGGNHDVVLTKDRKLIDCPVLISGGYDEAVSAIAGVLVNSVADTAGWFDQDRIQSHNLNARSAALFRDRMLRQGIPAPGAFPEDSHAYAGVGYAEAAIPEEIAVSNLVGRVMREMYTPAPAQGAANAPEPGFYSRERRFTRAEFESAVRDLLGMSGGMKLDGHSLCNRIFFMIQSNAKVQEVDTEITYNDLVQGNFEAFFRSFHVEKTVARTLCEMEKGMRELCDSLENNARRVMSRYGPRAIQYLYEGTGPDDEHGLPGRFPDISLRGQMETVESELHRLAATPAKYPGPLPDKGVLGRITARRSIEEWRWSALRAAQTDVHRRIAEEVLRRGVWRHLFCDRFMNFMEECIRFASILEMMTDRYTYAGTSLDAENANAFFREEGPDFVNLCCEEAGRQWIRGQIDRHAAGINMVHARMALVDDFYMYRDDWISDQEGRARDRFDDVLSRICGLGGYAFGPTGFRLTAEEYITGMTNAIPPQAVMPFLQNLADTVMHRLCGKSEMTMAPEHMGRQPAKRIVLLPGSLGAGPLAWNIQNAFQQHLLPGDTLGFVPGLTSIVCCRVSGGNGLGVLPQLPVWEQCYDHTAGETMHRTTGRNVPLHMRSGFSQYRELTKTQTNLELHLPAPDGLSAREETVFGTGLSWRHYPSVNLHCWGNEGPAPVDTSEVRYLREVFLPKADLATELGIIECERTGHVVRYFLNLIPGSWQDLSVDRYLEMDSDGRLLRGRPLFEYLKGMNSQAWEPCRVQIALPGSPAFGEDGFDFSQVAGQPDWTEERIARTHRGYMLRILRKATGLYQTLEDTLCRYYEVEKALQKREAALAGRRRAEDFVNFFLFGVIGQDDWPQKWTARIDEAGTEEVLFDIRRERLSLSPFRRRLLETGLMLAVVYGKYLEMVGAGSLKEEKLKEVYQLYMEERSDAEREELLDDRTKILQEEVNTFSDLTGGRRDLVKAVMDVFEIDDGDRSSAERLVELYRAGEKALREWRMWG